MAIGTDSKILAACLWFKIGWWYVSGPLETVSMCSNTYSPFAYTSVHNTLQKSECRFKSFNCGDSLASWQHWNCHSHIFSWCLLQYRFSCGCHTTLTLVFCPHSVKRYFIRQVPETATVFQDTIISYDFKSFGSYFFPNRQHLVIIRHDRHHQIHDRQLSESHLHYAEELIDRQHVALWSVQYPCKFNSSVPTLMSSIAGSVFGYPTLGLRLKEFCPNCLLLVQLSPMTLKLWIMKTQFRQRLLKSCYWIINRFPKFIITRHVMINLQWLLTVINLFQLCSVV